MNTNGYWFTERKVYKLARLSLGQEASALAQEKVTKTVAPPSDLVDKDTLTGAVMTVLEKVSERPSTLEGAAEGAMFRVYRIQVEGQDETELMSGGTVLDKQIEETGMPFRAKLVRPKGKRYHQFQPV